MPTYQELLAQHDALEVQINASKAEARNTVLAEIRWLVSEFDIAEREIYGAMRSRRRERPRAKYRDPKTRVTWSGRGRPPAWINGKDRNMFTIEQ
ncbi:H-NS family nucleoid-associated regulatory protein [Burkholderia ubonensis]|uniref:H-NS histone family protein n=1 Tax=Burkholderia ubonensis TaxID=101571 RepID=UPI0009B2FBBB|nr:H-NS histone family protein [Burkholderia ubonensis]